MLSFSRPMRAAALGLLLVSSVACGDNADHEKIVDALVTSTVQMYAAIDEDSTWLITADEGSEVSGTVQSPGGGEMKVVGWRQGGEHTTDANFHLAFSERLVLDFNNYLATDTTLSGQVVMTRHSLDIGPLDGASITDASRTTVYKGNLIGGGAAPGTYAVDVHGQASGVVVWTCGTVNDEPYAAGSCY